MGYAPAPMGCLFCNVLEKKIPADIVYEDEHALAFRDIRPVAPSHVLVIPRKHIAAMHDLTDADVTTIGQVMLAAKRVAHQLGLEIADPRRAEGAITHALNEVFDGGVRGR